MRHAVLDGEFKTYLVQTVPEGARPADASNPAVPTFAGAQRFGVAVAEPRTFLGGIGRLP